MSPITPPGMACEPDDEDEDDTELASDLADSQPTTCVWQRADAETRGLYRRPDPPSMEEISRELDRLRDRGLLGD